MASGAITRRQIIEDEALSWGPEYAKNLEAAIAKNKEFVATVLAYAEANEKLRSSGGQKDFLENLRKSNELAEKSATVWKEQNQLELQLISTKKKNELATEGTNRALVKERTLLAETNKELKQSAREQLGLVGAYEKLNRQRNESQKRLADLLSAEKKNIVEIQIAKREFEQLDARVKAVDASIKNYSKNIGNYSSAFKGLGGTMREVMSAFGLVTGIALFGNILRDTFNTIKEFDRQLIAVGKTTDITGESLKEFGREVVELGQQTEGVSIDGLLKSSEVAGQLGVKGTDNILKFSAAIEKLKLTSNIISDEQVGEFAKFIEVSSDSFESADKLASVITQLGNSMATTEAEVLANSTEIQKGIAVYATSAQGVLALGAATSTLGSEAEASRSAIQSTFAVINNAVAKGENLEEVLRITGLTQKELSEQFNKDATGVFQKFIGGLSRAKDQGENLTLVMDGLGITEKRAATVVGALASNYGVLEGAMSAASSEYENNAALNKEVAAASESISSILGDLKDEWDALVLSTNDAGKGTEAITTILKYLRDNLQGAITGLVKWGSVLLTIVGVYKLVNFAISAYSAIQAAATAAQVRFALTTGIGTQSILAQAAAARAATAAQTGLNTAVAATPWGIILAALAAIVVAYQVFNDELSAAERLTKRLGDETKRTQEKQQASINAANEFRARNFKQIEDEIRLRRAQGENEKKLSEEEIARKKKLLEIELETAEQSVNAQINNTKTLIEESQKRIRQMQLEREAGSTTGRRRDQLEGQIATSSDDLKSLQNRLKLETNLRISERSRLQALIAELDKEAQVKSAEQAKADADRDRENAEKARRERERSLKERFDRESKVADDEFKLRQFYLQKTIDAEKEIVSDENATLDERIDALTSYLSADYAKNEEAAERKLKMLGSYNEKTGKFVQELTDAEIAEILRGGFAREAMTAEQLLIYEEFQRNMSLSAKKGEEERQKLIDSQDDILRKRMEAEAVIRETQMNNELLAEAERFNALDEANRKTEDAIEQHERNKFEIKKKYALDGLKMQIDAIDQLIAKNAELPANEQMSADEIARINKWLTDLKLQYNDLAASNYVENNEKRVLSEEETNQLIKDLTAEAVSEVSNLVNTLFERKMSNIDAEIEKNNEYYGRLIELAANDEVQRDLLQRERDKKNAELEKKKRAEAIKQAIFNKGIMAAQTIANTATSIVKALAEVPFPASTAVVSLYAGIGALQLATILATPLPKYKDGRKGGPEEIAVVGDGYRSEVITDGKGRNPRLTPAVPTLVKLDRGDMVHKSVEDYERYLTRAAFRTSIASEKGKLDEHQAAHWFDKNYSNELLEEMRAMRKTIAKQKQKITVQPAKVDIDHAIWAMGNKKWN